MDIDLDLIIAGAGFDDDDRDLGTSGLCGTFALALHDALGEGRLALLCPNDATGRPLRVSGGELQWRHAVLFLDGALHDIDGKVELDHAIENYCWGNPEGDGGSLVFVSRDRFEEIMKGDSKSFDQVRLERWKAMLDSAMTKKGAKPRAPA